MRAFVPKGWSRPILTDSNKNVNSWAQLVAEGASRALEQSHGAGVLMMDGVRLTVGFYLPRPKKYQKRGVEPAHLTKPDLDKLVRGVKDALTKVLWVDDSQVVEVIARKAYAPMDVETQDKAMRSVDAASAAYPQVVVGGCGLHVCWIDGEWQVWMNAEDATFTGLCVATGATRDLALADAVATLEAAVAQLQKPVL